MAWTFDWNLDKAAANHRKHHVTFDEAATVFDDANAKPEFDRTHSQDEDRWLAIGVSNRWRLLTVAYTKRDEKTIRIISARRANQAEKSRYTGQG